jgi:hypothetical protein
MARRPNTIAESEPPVLSNTPRPRECFSLIGQAVNGRQVSITLPNEQNGVVLYWGNAEFWNIRGASLRGNWRHSCSEQVLKRMRKLDANFKISTATARLLALGGVKSSGASRLMTPVQIDQARAMNPLIEMFGCNDPAFFAGATYVSHMRSDDPIDRDRSNARAYHLQVVRRPLSHGPFTSNDLSDPEKIAEFTEVNRYRSQLDGLSKLITRLEGSLARKADPKTQKQLDTAFVELQKLTKRTFTSAAEVREFFDEELDSIRARGHSTVSEQTIPLGQEVIPSGTKMSHSLHMIGASRIGCGLLIDGISARNFLRPFIGGRAASGCGGYIASTYTVKRQDNDQLVDDCTIELVPEQHIRFHDAEHSLLRECYEEWLACDISQYDFTYEGLQRLAAGNGAVTEDEPC